MSNWKEQFESHPLHKTLEELESAVAETPEGADQAHLSELRRMRKILRLLRERLEEADPELVAPGQLDKLNDLLGQQSVLNQIRQYQETRNPTLLESANNQITPQLPTLAALLPGPVPCPTPDSVRALEADVDAVAKGVSERRRQVEQVLEGLEEAIARQKGELQKLDASIAAQGTRLDSQLSGWQGQFSRAQEERSKIYDEWRRDTERRTEERLQNLFQEAQGKMDETHKGFTEELKELLDDARKKHGEIVDLYQLTAGDSVAGAYLQNAEHERHQANFWRWFSVGFIMATAAWLGFVWYHYIGGPPTDVGWARILTAFSLTGVLLFGAAYGAQQSARHRASERQTRWFALELKAIDPFIHSLAEEDQRELKKALSDRLFGHARGLGSPEPALGDHHAFKLLTKSVVDLLGGLSKLRR